MHSLGVGGTVVTCLADIPLFACYSIVESVSLFVFRAHIFEHSVCEH